MDDWEIFLSKVNQLVERVEVLEKKVTELEFRTRFIGFNPGKEEE